MTPELRALGRRRYIALTTFRRTGVGVPTPVWVAPADDALVVMTTSTTGKAKRLRNDPRVELQECDARGRVRPGAPVVLGSATVIADPSEVDRLLSGHRAKYGWQFRGFRLIEHLLARRSAKARAAAAASTDVVLLITDR